MFCLPRKKQRRPVGALRTGFLAIVLIAPSWASATMLTVMLESETDLDSLEVGLRQFATYDDLINDIALVPEAFSAINPSASYSTTGLAWDGSNYIVQFERESDADVFEVAYRSYATYDDMLTDTLAFPEQPSAINPSSNYSTTGLTWDGSQYIVQLERETNSDVFEIAYRKYATFDDVLTDTLAAPEQWSAMNPSSLYSTTGLDWDGSNYIVQLEREVDADFFEIAYRRYATFDDVLTDTLAAPEQWSALNPSALYSTTGLASFPMVSVPEPSTFLLLNMGIAGLATGLRRRRSSSTAHPAS